MYLLAINLLNHKEFVSMQIKKNDSIYMGRNPKVEDSIITNKTKIKFLKIFWLDRLISRSHCIAERSENTIILKIINSKSKSTIPNPFYSMVEYSVRKIKPNPVKLNYGNSVVVGAKGNTAIFWLKSLSDLDDKLNDYNISIEKSEKFNSFNESSLSFSNNYEDLNDLDEYSLRFQLKLLQEDLPKNVLSGWNEEEDLFIKSSIFLEKSLPGQKNVNVSFLSLSKDNDIKYKILNLDPLARPDFYPSKTLLNKVNLDNIKSKDIYIWSMEDNSKLFEAKSLEKKIDWVIILPLSQISEKNNVYRNKEEKPVFLYIEARNASRSSATSFIPFIRLISSLLASILSAKKDQKLQNQISTYFSPGLRKLMKHNDQSILNPGMVNCTVMFADRRGHSRILESAKKDEDILDKLEENQEVVGIITENIFKNNGVVTDFTGDGALGLWGWPKFDNKENNHALESIESAKAIIYNLSNKVIYEKEHDRKMSAVRIGISSGRMAVGKTGPSQQWHISVFGRLANLGARLERIAKEFKIPIIISEETYLQIKHINDYSFRKLCLISPIGFQENYPIYEYVLPTEVGGSGVTLSDIKKYEEALDKFHNKKWNLSLKILDAIKLNDPAKIWLQKKISYFIKNPPKDNWNGEVNSLSK